MNTRLLFKVFAKCPAVKLAYFFGSRARGDAGTMSDFDFAVYLDEPNLKKRFQIRLQLLADLSSFFKTDAVDLVVLNDTHNSELKYHIVHEGKLVYGEEATAMMVEPRILNEYFDFRYTMRKYHLTKA